MRENEDGGLVTDNAARDGNSFIHRRGRHHLAVAYDVRAFCSHNDDRVLEEHLRKHVSALLTGLDAVLVHVIQHRSQVASLG